MRLMDVLRKGNVALAHVEDSSLFVVQYWKGRRTEYYVAYAPGWGQTAQTYYFPTKQALLDAVTAGTFSRIPWQYDCWQLVRQSEPANAPGVRQ